VNEKPSEREVAELLSLSLDDELTEQQQKLLRSTLSENATARQRYVEMMLLDTMLAEELSADAMVQTVDLIGGMDLAAISILDTPIVVPTRAATSVFPRWFGYTIAAGLLFAITIGIATIDSRKVSAAALVAQSRRVHGLALDRCYVINVARLQGGAEQNKSMPFGRSIIAKLLVNRVDRLWTRGDRFFIESSSENYRWVWGQDETGDAWLALNRRVGLRLDVDELPNWLSTICELLSMRVDALLEDVLQGFYLNRDSSDDPSVYIVRATPKSDRQHRWIQEVVMEIDVGTKVLRRVSITRMNANDAIVKVTYKLAATEAQPDASYSLEGQLDSPAQIYSRTNRPDRRDEILTRLFGPAETLTDATTERN